ncbi:hypothetical protein ASPZODRAFT_137897 [Penicilliopsis zonata CBS 506.65]|uniref:Enoyl reductase (ER) domain-containing protein n=1 Tax=Penicilliopsis zonata CBS 506.65 TaxID=1073090 RepID=A0A1L9SU59_9EURO|nr:hypothetical protein ASPZODRAFT_137897 [Penicilliopsis zonata CBS 506.65]OJJ50755.1 hypothetical protein ASPZODRAFT_137897 [Penicilliopsis zonata CBS 506.65]
MSDSIANVPSTMRAWIYSQKGRPSQVIRLDPAFPAPSVSSLQAGEVLVKITHATFNAGNTLLMQALPTFLRKMPAIPEMEFCGTILAAGSNIASSRPELAVGTVVIGMCPLGEMFRKGRGVLAEYLATTAEAVVSIPRGISTTEAAGIGGVGCTALQVTDLLGLKRGQSVLVNGGSAGSGVMMVQVAKYLVGETGRVVATCSAANAELVRSIGADEVIDYRVNHPLYDYLITHYATQRFDAIIDCIGIQELYLHSPAYLCEGGKYLNIGAYATKTTLAGVFQWTWNQYANRFCPVWLGGIPRWYMFYSATPDVPTLNRVRQMVEEGHLKQVVDSVWEMEDVKKAYERMESKRTRGKIIIHIQD